MNFKHPKPMNLLKRNTSRTTLFIVIGALIISMPLKTQAQKTVLNQAQLWYAYFNNLKFSNKYRLLTDIQERQFIEPVGAQGTFLFRSILYRNLGGGWEA